MKKLIVTSIITITTLILSSCGNEVEEIKNPSTGQLTLRYEYYKDDSGQKIKDGEYFEFYPNGKKKIESHYKDGVLEGTSIYYESEDVIAFNNYKNGKLDGECRTQNSKGIITNVYHYKKDKLDGQTVYNFDNGKPHIKINYKNGIPSGKCELFDNNGKISSTLNFNNGAAKEFTGKWKVENVKEQYYEFDNIGDMKFYAPLFRYSNDPVVLYSGFYTIGKSIKFFTLNGRLKETYSLIEISKNKIVVFDETNLEENIWTRIK